MKRIMPLIVLALVFSVAYAQAAPKKANQGQCVKDCVQAFNKSAKDSGATFNPDKAAQKECASWCKNDYTPGDGYFWDDGVCNENYQDTDPNCEVVAQTPDLKGFGEVCAGDWECQSGNCDMSGFAAAPTCMAP